MASKRSIAAKKMWKRRKLAKYVASAGYPTETNAIKSADKITGLIDRMTQAIDKIQTQIERLESL